MRRRNQPLLALTTLLLTIACLSWLSETLHHQPAPEQTAAWLTASRQASVLFPERVTAELISAVGAIVPQGWSVQWTHLGCSPTDWRSFDDRAGFLVEAGDGTDWLRVWFLPADWIGIRMVENQSWCSCYWERVLKNDHYTMISHASREEYHHRCDRLLDAWTPSLCNGGRAEAERLFGHHSQATDRVAAELVKRHCHTAVELGEAANSLIVLGVPARSVLLRAIREIRPEEMRYGLGLDGIYRVLGDMGDAESVGVLCDCLRERPTRYIVGALAGAKHPQLGPALHEALCKARDGEDIAAIAHELGCQRYHPAGADLLVVFKRMANLVYGDGAVANALAALRFREAIPAIEKACAKLPPDEWGNGNAGGVRLALARFTGDWGIPARGHGPISPGRLMSRPASQSRCVFLSR